jgi:hypothetical protein
MRAIGPVLRPEQLQDVATDVVQEVVAKNL